MSLVTAIQRVKVKLDTGTMDNPTKSRCFCFKTVRLQQNTSEYMYLFACWGHFAENIHLLTGEIARTSFNAVTQTLESYISFCLFLFFTFIFLYHQNNRRRTLWYICTEEGHYSISLHLDVLIHTLNFSILFLSTLTALSESFNNRLERHNKVFWRSTIPSQRISQYICN